MIITENNNVFKLEEDYPFLFNYLITRLPTKSNSWNKKKDFKFRRETKTSYNLHNKKFIEYNQKWVSFIIIDIDNKTLEESLEIALKLDLEPSFSCSTDKGCHLFYSLENIVKYEWEKPINFLRDIKQSLTYYLGGDINGSHRLKGIWRNPLQHNFHWSGGIEYSLNDFKELCIKFKTKDYKPQQKFDNYKNKVKRFNKNFNFVEGNRDNFLFFFGMLYSKDKNYTLDQIENLLNSFQNQETTKNLELKEVSKISRSIYKYNKNGKNFITKESFKNRGVLNLPGIYATLGWLEEEEYKKEVKKRQSLGGKYLQQQLKNKDIEMTRKENLTRVNKEKGKTTQKKIHNFITGMFAEEYKWDTEGNNKGKWNVSKLSKELNISRPTLIKHLEELGEL